MSLSEPRYDYDLAVIGTGPGGQWAAITAAKAGHRVAIIERKTVVGGTCINTGTIPSKSLREAVLYLSGWREHTFYGSSYAVKRDITISDLLVRTNFVIQHELDVIQHQMYRNGIDLLRASASFADPHTLRLTVLNGIGSREIRARFTVIATGTDAALPSEYVTDDCSIFTSDAILTLDRIPHSLTVIGAGVIGCEYASMFSALGTRVTLIDARPTLLSFIDEEVADALAFHLRENNVTLRLHETVAHLERREDGHVETHLKSGKHLTTEKALYCVGRVGATADLNLAGAGLATTIGVASWSTNNIEPAYRISTRWVT